MMLLESEYNHILQVLDQEEEKCLYKSKKKKNKPLNHYCIQYKCENEKHKYSINIRCEK